MAPLPGVFMILFSLMTGLAAVVILFFISQVLPNLGYILNIAGLGGVVILHNKGLRVAVITIRYPKAPAARGQAYNSECKVLAKS